uniref:Uncharacterized protein n=2 Tax=Oryza sativa subsp. japonica TaxID=39947 RepID=Q2R632_ORYSJ|nr:hypothetical protein LOC_Os11g22450 [Oryza sativa Japonica Group]ABA93164.1 hypothetical protein LOC_Os11g22450 [Oryza sativa Japonica Group]
MPISKLDAPLAGVHEGFKRGHRGDVDDAVARLGLLRFDSNEDDVPMAASSARSRALSSSLGMDNGVWRCSWEEEKARLGDAQGVEQAKEAAMWAQGEGNMAQGEGNKAGL